ncbi:MAG TPA: hypothetical protein VIK70_01175 [Lysobacter sp.]
MARIDASCRKGPASLVAKDAESSGCDGVAVPRTIGVLIASRRAPKTA